MSCTVLPSRSILNMIPKFNVCRVKHEHGSSISDRNELGNVCCCDIRLAMFAGIIRKPERTKKLQGPETVYIQ